MGQRKYRINWAWALIITMLPFYSGCAAIAPSVIAVKEAGFTESGRKEAFNKSIRGFYSALFWQNIAQALDYVDENNRDSMFKWIRSFKRPNRIVDTKIESLTFDEGAFSAEVEVSRKIMNDDTRVVKTVVQKEIWVFSRMQGWKVKSVQNVG
ncbi:MAG: hypothetical protein D6808_05765 [Candidatus Dadabacteria bacterium]|nr:MAG: hypothetical protein D6808_05765 [Candidatus Dadabacteria bacterium]